MTPTALVIMPWWVCSALPSRASVNLEWRQEPAAVHVGDILRIGLYAVSDDPQTSQAIAGLDVIVAWDTTLLRLLGVDDNGPYNWLSSGLPIGDPFGLNEQIPPLDGDGLYLAQGNFSQIPQATPDGLLVTTFEFEALASGCGPLVTMLQSAGTPTTHTVVWSGIVPGTPVTGQLSAAMVVIDDTAAPVFTLCQDITADADPQAGGPCERVLDPAVMINVTDDCDPAPALSCARDDGLDCLADPYPCGVTTLTWTATDLSGNTGTCIGTVTVTGYVVNAGVELQGVSAPSLDRCVTFELHTCLPGGSSCPGAPDPLVVDQVVTFVNGLGVATFAVPCGDYGCITARDRLHTLRRTITPIPTNGSQLEADFTSTNPAGDKALVGGNLNDDCWIDIADYGLFAGQWGASLPAHTDCSSSFPPAHADISGNGLVWTEDYTYIQLNMWQFSEENCCATNPLCDGAGSTPGDLGSTQRMSVEALHRLGAPDAAAGDLNRDGWLDRQDLMLWMHGMRPLSSPVQPMDEGGRSDPGGKKNTGRADRLHAPTDQSLHSRHEAVSQDATRAHAPEPSGKQSGGTEVG